MRSPKRGKKCPSVWSSSGETVSSFWKHWTGFDGLTKWTVTACMSLIKMDASLSSHQFSLNRSSLVSHNLLISQCLLSLLCRRTGVCPAVLIHTYTLLIHTDILVIACSVINRCSVRLVRWLRHCRNSPVLYFEPEQCDSMGAGKFRSQKLMRCRFEVVQWHLMSLQSKAMHEAADVPLAVPHLI